MRKAKNRLSQNKIDDRLIRKGDSHENPDPHQPPSRTPPQDNRKPHTEAGTGLAIIDYKRSSTDTLLSSQTTTTHPTKPTPEGSRPASGSKRTTYTTTHTHATPPPPNTPQTPGKPTKHRRVENQPHQHPTHTNTTQPSSTIARSRSAHYALTGILDWRSSAGFTAPSTVPISLQMRLQAYHHPQLPYLTGRMNDLESAESRCFHQTNPIPHTSRSLCRLRNRYGN